MKPGTLIPLWVGVPIGSIIMVLVAAHALALLENRQPTSRKRIRLASDVLILLEMPLLTIGTCVLRAEAQPREWALVWLSAMVLMALILLLSVADVVNTMRLARGSQRRIQADLRGRRSTEKAGGERASGGAE